VRQAHQPRVHYGWVVAAVTLVALVISAGFRSMAGLLIGPLEDEFGWSAGTISIAVTINLLLFGLVGPFSAALMDRIGVRRVIVGALVSIAVAASLTTLIDSPWQLYLLWGVVMGLATGSISVPLAALIASRWFVERRGLVTGFLSAANATGQLVFLPLLAVVLVAAGWRASSWTIAAVAVGIVVPLVAFFIRDSPESMGLRPYGAGPAPSQTPGPAPGNPFAVAWKGFVLGSRSGVFWLLCGTFFVCGATTTGLIATHLIPAARDHGIDEVTAATLLAGMGAFDIIGTTVSGYLTDRLDSRWLLFWYYGLRGVALIALPAALGAPRIAVLLFVALYGLDWVATVPPTIALTASTFGRENVGVVFGWIFASHQIGAAVAAGVAGGLRDWLGDYTISFVGGGALCLLASVLVLRIGKGRSGLVPATDPA